MASNSFGTRFRITTWGESHGTAIGVVIDGCPSRVPLNLECIQKRMDARRPENETPYVSARREKDAVTLLSGVFDGVTTGAPIALLIANHDVDTSAYQSVKDVLRPGHANATYLAKYGLCDWAGGGRASARETAARVAAGAVAEQFVAHRMPLRIVSALKGVGTYISKETISLDTQRTNLFCATAADEEAMCAQLEAAKIAGDSIGGIVETVLYHVPVGLGDPVYKKVSAQLAAAMMSIPGAKAFEIGEGCASAAFRGSHYHDQFYKAGDRVRTKTNHCGGVLGGITTGEPIIIRTYFKPTPTIMLPQESIDTDGNPAICAYPQTTRADTCIAIRAVPVCAAMAYITMADFIA